MKSIQKTLSLLIIMIVVCFGCKKSQTQSNNIAISSDHSVQVSEKSKNQYIRKYVTSFLKNNDFDGFVLAQSKGKTVIAESFSNVDQLTDASTFMIGSITKTFTADAINILINQGAIKLDTKISDIISVDDEIHNEITIKQLLTHTSGIPDYYNIDEFRKIRQKKMPLENFYNWISKFPLDFKPGEGDSYSNSGYNLAALIIEKATKTNYSKFLNDNLFSPLGMTSSGSIESGNVKILVSGFEPGNYPNSLREPKPLDNTWLIGSGSVYSNANDLLKWCNHVKKRLQSGEKWKPYGWGIRKRGSEFYLEQNGRIPGYSASIHVYPETDVVIILLNRVESDAVGQIAKGISDILHNEDVIIPEKRDVQKVAVGDLKNYIGVYQITPNFYVTVSIDDNGLGIATGRGSDLSYAVLDPLVDDKFFFRVGYTEVTFDRNNKGKITGLFWGNSGPFPKVQN